MSLSKPGRLGLRVALLGAASILAVSSANATLVNTIPGGTVVTPPNNGTVPASFYSTTGPIQIGTGAGRDIVWTSNSSSAVGGYSGGYGLCNNGSWTGSPPYFGTNSPNNAQTMTFTFNDGDVSSAGGFMSWGRGCFGSENFTIEARNASNSLLESYSFNFATSGAANTGEFWAIQRATADIRSFIVYGGFAVLRDFTFLGPTGCPVSAGDDTCLIDSATDQSVAIDALGHVTGDTLQLGGATNFNFDVAKIGTIYTNFEVFQKIDASNVTLTGTAGVAANWQVLAGTLTASGGSAIWDLSNVDVAAAATLALASSETIGSLTGAAGSFVTLGGNTLLLGGDNSSTTFAGVISGSGNLNKSGTGNFILSGANTFSGGYVNVSDGTLTLAGGAALNDSQLVDVVNTGILALSASETIGSLGGNGAVSLNANTLTTGGNGNSSTFSGVISGVGGGLIKAGAGTMTLSGANTFTGNVEVIGGILALSGGAAIANSTNVVTTAPGTLRVDAAETIGSLNGSGATVLNASLTTGGNNQTTLVSGAISGAGGLTKLGTGTMTLSGANTYSGPTNVNAGTLALAGGSAIANTGAVTVAGGATLALSASEQIGNLSGAGLVSLGGNTLTTGDASNTSFTGTTSGAGGITKVGAGKFTTLALANTGTNTINAGEWNINGAVAGNMVVNAGGTLSGTNTIAGNLTLNAGGTLKSGNSPGITAVAGNFIGGGVMAVEVQFNNAGAPVNGTTHDFLNITGNASNVTTLNIVPFAPSTAPTATTGNGIELVRVGGATTAGAFVLSGPVIQGGFQYLLNYVADYSGANDGYFLKSAAIQEVSLNAALNAASRASNMACSDRNHGHPGLDGAKGRFWADASDDNLSSDAANGVDFDADTNCYRAGFTAQAGGNLQVGVSGGMSSSSVDVNLAQGLATMDGDGIAIKASAAYVKDKMFVEGTLGYASTDWSIVKAAGAGVAGATIDGLTGHLGAGYRTPVFGPVTATLSAGVDYDGTSCGGGCLVAGASEELSNWSAGVHARFDAAFSNGRVKPYAQLGFTTDLDGGHSVSFGGATTSVDAMSGLVHGDLGLEANVWKSVSIYAQGGVIEGLDSETSGHSGKIGAKITW